MVCPLDFQVLFVIYDLEEAKIGKCIFAEQESVPGEKRGTSLRSVPPNSQSALKNAL